MIITAYLLRRSLIKFFVFLSCAFGLIFLLPQPIFAASSLQSSSPEDLCLEGINLFENGEIEEAQLLLGPSFIEIEKNHFSDPIDLGACAFGLGQIYHQLGDHKSALPAFVIASEVFSAIDYVNYEGWALMGAGKSSRILGEYENALDYNFRALSIFQQFVNSGSRDYYQDESITLSNIGLIYHKLGDYEEAIEYHLEAMLYCQESAESSGFSCPPSISSLVLNNLGVVFESQGKYSDALEVYFQSLSFSDAAGEPYRQIFIYSNIGVVYKEMGRFDKAREYYERALELSMEYGNKYTHASVLNNMGLLPAEKTNKIVEQSEISSIDYFKEVLEMRQEVGDREGEAITLINLGIEYHRQGDFSEALLCFEKALDIFSEIENSSGEMTALGNIADVRNSQGETLKAIEIYNLSIDDAKRIGDRDAEAYYLQEIGTIFQARGEKENSLEYYEQAMDAYELLRVTTRNDLSRITLGAMSHKLYDNAIDLYLRQNQPQLAFIVSERGRARSFLDSLDTGYIEFSDELNIIYDDIKKASIELQTIRENLQRAKEEKQQDSNLIAELEEQYKQAESNFQATADTVVARGDQLTQFIPGQAKIYDVSGTQTLLDKDSTLLSYWVMNDQTVVFIISKESFSAVSLDVSKDELLAIIEAFRRFDNVNEAYPESTLKLYHALFSPIENYINTSQVIIIPHDVLHYFPFSALSNGENHLVDKYSIHYLPSVSSWPYIKLNASYNDEGYPIILGDPKTNNDELIPLPYARQEVKVIAALFNSDPVVGKDATESLLREFTGEAYVLHLATHGKYNTVNPLYSSLYLSPDDSDDGLLDTIEIYGLDLSQTNLVVLSSCESQVGDLHNGDEIVGLTRAFFFAGTPNVLASLWQVNDRTTQILMENFYTNWLGGMSKADALRQAQITVRKDYPNPYYWAGFVLNGTDTEEAPVPIDKYGGLKIAGVVIATVCCFSGLILLFLALIVYKQKRRK